MKIRITTSDRPEFLNLTPWDPFVTLMGEEVANEIKKYSKRMWVEFTPSKIYYYADLTQKHFTFLKLKYPDINNK